MSNITEKMQSLLDFLRENKDNRGVMANLRCALNSNKEQRAWAILARYGGLSNKEREAKTISIIAGLFASHSLETEKGNFGSTCLHLCSNDEKPWADKKPGSMATHFQWLLEADETEIFKRVIRFVLRAKNANVAVNYQQLGEDLWSWNNDKTKRNWAREFWSPVTKDDDGGKS